MSVVKQQHYVPQFYLKNFANEKEQIWVYDKVTDKSFQTHIKNVAGERYFYDVPSLDQRTGVKQSVEKLLSHVEDKMSEVLNTLLQKLATNNFIRLHDDQRNFLSIFMVVQMLRSKEHRVMQEHSARSMSRFLKKRLTDQQIIEAFGSEALHPPTAESLAEVQASCLADQNLIREMAMILNGHIWVIYKVRHSGEFLTSDNPFTKRGHIKHPVRRLSGIRSPGIEISLPISPEFCLCLAERSFFIANEKYDGRVVDINDTQNMIYYNYERIKFATRYLFSSSGDFRFVKQVCEEEPILKDPLRKRIASNHDGPGDTIED